MRKTKKIFFTLLIVILIIFLLFILFKFMTKNRKNGNNMNSQEIVDNIKNLTSYTAKVKVQVNSNKNTNKYILLQKYSQECSMQEVIEPENIAGVKIIKKDNNLSVENSGLDLKTIFENYIGLEDNSLDLINFINEYKENNQSNFEEKNGEIILKTKANKENKYLENKILYIDKENIKPKKLIIQDNNQNMTIIIEYIEIELN